MGTNPMDQKPPQNFIASLANYSLPAIQVWGRWDLGGWGTAL